MYVLLCCSCSGLLPLFILIHFLNPSTYTDDFGIGARYIGYLIGKSELFLEVLTTIRENY